MKQMFTRCITIALFFLWLPTVGLTQESIQFVPSTGIWFSDPSALEGEEVKIYTAVINNVYEDATIIVTFFDNGQVIRSVEAPIGYEEARQLSTTWIPGPGQHEISAALLVQEAVTLAGEVIEATDEEAAVLGRLVATAVVIEPDTDGDKIRDELDLDDDNDGLLDTEEVELGTDPYEADTDGDGLSDGEEEIDVGTDPLDEDTDGDGLEDGQEQLSESIENDVEIETELPVTETDPLDADTDDDGLDDGEEVLETLTDPLDADTDDDEVPDGEDAFPLEREEQQDTDGDGSGNYRDPDDDNDGISDEEEAKLGTDPLREDTDKNGIPDGEEAHVLGTDPLREDTDGDGIFDGAELRAKTDPLDPDTDGDGTPDGEDRTPRGIPPVLMFAEGVFRNWPVVLLVVVLVVLGRWIQRRRQ